MDKVIIVGTYEFIGFQLCLSLLEQGIEVIGIHFSNVSEDPFLEEKRFEIGRNSNFTEENETYFDSLEPFSDSMIVFIDYYSYYFKREEKQLHSFLTTELLMKCPFHFVLTIPIQLCNDKIPLELPLFQQSNNKFAPFIFYLPTVYGPWQPMKYVFQQVLNNPDAPISMDDREWTEDALYIEDVIEVIVNYSNRKESKAYVLKSKYNDQWKALADILFDECPMELPQYEVKPFNQDLIVIHVGETKPQDGIENQRRHLTRLKKIW